MLEARLAPVALLLLAVAAAGLATAGHPVGPGVHAPTIVEVHHAPERPERGEPVTITARVQDPSAVSGMGLLHCRAEQYACGPAQRMERSAPGTFRGTIPWHEEFFRPALHVGYNLTIGLDDGAKETSPMRNWPATPPSLPAEAGIYYFYDLPAEDSSAPTVGLALVLVALATIVLARRWSR